MLSKIVCWGLGLTKEKRTELSGIIYEIAVVRSKNHKKWEVNSALDLTMDNAYPNMARSKPPLALTKGEEYKISFKGKTVNFNLDNKEIFNSFKEGDEAELGYKEVCENTYDHLPPNFDTKSLINGVLTEYRFVSAKRTTFGVSRVD